MSILIKGMEMPPEGKAESVTICSGGTVYAFGLKKIGTAVPIPPHGRLGDLDRLAKEVEDMIKEFPLDSIGAERYRLFAELIKTAPTVIPASEKEKLNDNS